MDLTSEMYLMSFQICVVVVNPMMMLICPFDNLPQRADRWLLALIAAQGDRELRNEHILPQVTGPSLNGLNRGKNREQEVHHEPEGR